MSSAVQAWVSQISIMQQSVLLSAIRGPDGMGKFHKCKPLIRWYRRCVLISAFDGCVIDHPFAPGGGSFTGPVYEGFSDCECWEESIKLFVDNFMAARDELPYHYTVHFMHAVEVLGYKHPNERIRAFWNGVYMRMVNCLHLFPETEEQMDGRLSDNEKSWQARADEFAVCSD